MKFEHIVVLVPVELDDHAVAVLERMDVFHVDHQLPALDLDPVVYHRPDVVGSDSSVVEQERWQQRIVLPVRSVRHVPLCHTYLAGLHEPLDRRVNLEVGLLLPGLCRGNDVLVDDRQLEVSVDQPDEVLVLVVELHVFAVYHQLVDVDEFQTDVREPVVEHVEDGRDLIR